ncbi:aminotransferase-like domain-containing protein [Plastoroseomonas hellenica]|uniref:aminotransferase-like domain-containing protein n=1 Tax=Plastoroseomonas hellenica TaxID=2687306 RepID=UPI001BA44D6D|nr:PLP-dependent aminotransferase family protein [Plastoroseomonas hellenica]MBR0642624.1 PLP-dependent aminotransferase family protein [Plastoroseomonas hellenica]
MATAAYVALADRLAEEIAEGRLKPGDRLPPQRQFAYERGIAVSTASRIYTELLRRGLVVGEVGRGTFVSGQPRQLPAAAVREPGNPGVDLEFNFAILPEQSALMAKSLSALQDPEALQIALSPISSAGTAAARRLFAGILRREGWEPAPDTLLFTSGGRQSIAAAMATLVPTGGRCGVEAITYPLVKGIAARLGVTLVPLAIDEAGVRPDAIEKAHRETRLSALYLQPTLHNPLGMTMPTERRRAIARLAETLGITVIEDAIYGFLADEPPLAAFAPEHCMLVDGLSKRVAPGLTLGFVSTPPRFRETLMAAIRACGWMASGHATMIMERMAADGTIAELVKRKREDAKRRQRAAAECLVGLQIQADPRAYHLWLTLPEHWRSEAFVAAAARRGITLTPSSAFAVGAGHAPNAVRLALAAPPFEQLQEALRTLARMLHARETEYDFSE